MTATATPERLPAATGRVAAPPLPLPRPCSVCGRGRPVTVLPINGTEQEVCEGCLSDHSALIPELLSA